jgi:hypothetical protein
MPVSHELKCMFVHIPRTGGTSMEIALGLHGDYREENTASMFGRIKSPDLKRRDYATDYLQHLTAADLRRLLPEEFQRYFRFAFVRNPWERMVSVYCYHRKVTGEGTSFNEFLDQTENRQRNHLLPQHAFVFDESGECLVDFLGRFERLLTDFAEVCAALKVERELPHIYAATIGDYRSYYDETTRSIVERRYGEDIERFRYLF